MAIPATDKLFFVDVESALPVFATFFRFSGNADTSAVWAISPVLETDTFQKFYTGFMRGVLFHCLKNVHGLTSPHGIFG